jgi:hypothetical protein
MVVQINGSPKEIADFLLNLKREKVESESDSTVGFVSGIETKKPSSMDRSPYYFETGTSIC